MYLWLLLTFDFHFCKFSMMDWDIGMHLFIVCALHVSTVTALIPSITRMVSLSRRLLTRESLIRCSSSIEDSDVERETSMTAAGPEKSFRAHKFIPNSYLVPQFLSRNCHWQTIVGSNALQNKIFGLKVRPFRSTSARILTPDGDFFDVEFTDGYETTKGLVIISHGLESSARGEHASRFAAGCISKGFGCCLVNYRGCSGEPNRYKILKLRYYCNIYLRKLWYPFFLSMISFWYRRLGAYHLGFTTDLKQLITELNLRHPDLKLFLCGFSLGGNVSLKVLGELGLAARAKMNLLGAAVACVPFDPIASQGKLDRGFNRAVYSEVCI